MTPNACARALQHHSHPSMKIKNINKPIKYHLSLYIYKRFAWEPHVTLYILPVYHFLLIDHVIRFINHFRYFVWLYVLTHNGVIDAGGKQALIARSGFPEMDAHLSDLIRFQSALGLHHVCGFIMKRVDKVTYINFH